MSRTSRFTSLESYKTSVSTMSVDELQKALADLYAEFAVNPRELLVARNQYEHLCLSHILNIMTGDYVRLTPSTDLGYNVILMIE